MKRETTSKETRISFSPRVCDEINLAKSVELRTLWHVLPTSGARMLTKCFCLSLTYHLNFNFFLYHINSCHTTHLNSHPHPVSHTTEEGSSELPKRLVYSKLWLVNSIELPPISFFYIVVPHIYSHMQVLSHMRVRTSLLFRPGFWQAIGWNALRGAQGKCKLLLCNS